MASSLDRFALSRVLRAQDGLISYAQARDVGLSPSGLSRRVRPGGGWRRVLPHVYVLGEQPLTDRQRARAGVLFAGPNAALTGCAALHWHRLKHLPDVVRQDGVEVVGPPGRQLRSHDWVTVHRSGRPCDAFLVDGLRVVPVTRAVVDASLALPYETVLGVASAAVNAGRTTAEQLRDELAGASRRGSAALARALRELSAGVRSVAEATFLDVATRSGLPEPLVNAPLEVDGRWLVPDFRWGRVIVEVDSKAHHLLIEGGWESTQERRAFLFAHGYIVIPVTPEMLRRAPDEVIAAVLSALALVNAG